jgi:hypothetical protein
MKRVLLLPILAVAVVFATACGDDDDNKSPHDDAGAPAIYLYPETAQEVAVTLDPAEGCELVKTEPEYGDGWTVWAEPSGRIDGMYDYLYYTARVRDDFQMDHGWAVPAESIFPWFDKALPELGLTADETGDFVDYWSAHLPYAPCYRVYPQDNVYVDAQIVLTVEPAPDSVLRLWLVIIGEDECPAIEQPLPTGFDRNGFTVVEWGVVLRHSSFVW